MSFLFLSAIKTGLSPKLPPVNLESLPWSLTSWNLPAFRSDWLKAHGFICLWEMQAGKEILSRSWTRELSCKECCSRSTPVMRIGEWEKLNEISKVFCPGTWISGPLPSVAGTNSDHCSRYARTTSPHA